MTLRFLGIIFLFVLSCKPIEPVNFIEVKDVKINRSKDDGIFINAQIVLENPNKVKIIINEVDVDIYAEDIVLVSVKDNMPRELKESAESTIDIKGLINVDNLEKILNQKGLAIILGNEDIGLKFIGKIVAKAYGIKDEIEINYTIESVKGLIN